MKKFNYPYPEHNQYGVQKLLEDITTEIWAFQAESEQEELNIIAGLKVILEATMESRTPEEFWNEGSVEEFRNKGSVEEFNAKPPKPQLPLMVQVALLTELNEFGGYLKNTQENLESLWGRLSADEVFITSELGKIGITTVADVEQLEKNLKNTFRL
jgi:hypothetical protein